MGGGVNHAFGRHAEPDGYYGEIHQKTRTVSLLLRLKEEEGLKGEEEIQPVSRFKT